MSPFHDLNPFREVLLSMGWSLLLMILLKKAPFVKFVGVFLNYSFIDAHKEEYKKRSIAGQFEMYEENW